MIPPMTTQEVLTQLNRARMIDQLVMLGGKHVQSELRELDEESADQDS